MQSELVLCLKYNSLSYCDSSARFLLRVFTYANLFWTISECRQIAEDEAFIAKLYIYERVQVVEGV